MGDCSKNRMPCCSPRFSRRSDRDRARLARPYARAAIALPAESRIDANTRRVGFSALQLETYSEFPIRRASQNFCARRGAARLGLNFDRRAGGFPAILGYAVDSERSDRETGSGWVRGRVAVAPSNLWGVRGVMEMKERGAGRNQAPLSPPHVSVRARTRPRDRGSVRIPPARRI
jgi:hypothetical protein